MAIRYQRTQRKFLLRSRVILEGLVGMRMAQGYLISREDSSVRVRYTESETAVLSLKGPTMSGTRVTYESPIPFDLAELLVNLCEPAVITKVRFFLPYRHGECLVDVFEGANQGLALAEFWTEQPEYRTEVPPWCGREVTDDRRYYNEHLALNPYAFWPQEDR